jgi:hypothetical protein
MKKILFSLLLLFITSLYGFSQKSIELGLFGGGVFYLGDLNQGTPFLQTRPAYGGIARYNITDRWAMRLNVLQGKVLGDDEVSKANLERQLSFESNITEFSLVAEFNFFDYVTGSTRNYVAPYIFAGLGLFLFNPKAENVELKELGTEGQNTGYDGRKPYKTFSMAMPFGIGFKYSLTKKLGFAFEWGMRKTITDYIDDVSTTYYLDGESIDPGNTAQILSDPTRNHKPGMMRGNPRTKDWYSFFGVSVTYKFDLFRQYKCVDFGERRKY